MTTSPPRDHVHRSASPGLVAGLVTLVGLLALTKLSLLTPAFTDYEVETDPAMQALLAGDFGEGLRLLPVYGGAVLASFPGAWLTQLLGGGDLAIYRSIAVPGAIGLVTLSVVAARWLHEAGQQRSVQLVAAALLGLSPCVSLAWNIGHPEDVLVACTAIGGVILVARGGSRSIWIGGALLGLAIAGKASAIVVFPMAVAVMTSRRDLVRLVTSAGVAGVALLLPVVIPRFQHFTDVIVATGADRVSSKGNLWWFFGPSNPQFTEDPDVVQLFTTRNSARLAPEFMAAHSHELIVLFAIIFAAIWWWKVGRTIDPGHPDDRVASALLAVAAIVWWRSVGDPWFQAYYLTPAVLALVLADARLGRLPTTGLVAAGALWLIHGQNAPDMGLNADATSALRLAWLVPAGVWITIRALRPVR